MRLTGFRGGSSICELGSISDMMLFFDCIDAYVVSQWPKTDWSLITDRLYKRYIKQDDLPQTKKLMRMVEETFNKLPRESVDWDPIRNKSVPSCLDPSLDTLGLIFHKYFENFFHCAESAEANYEMFGSDPSFEYKPVRIVLTELPFLMVEKARPLKEYDELEGKPFWQT